MNRSFHKIKEKIDYKNYENKEDELNLNEPLMSFTGLSLFYEKPDWTSLADSIEPWTNMPYHLSLPYSKNHLTFSFIGVNHRAPTGVRYKFMLAGADTSWSKETEKTEIKK